MKWTADYETTTDIHDCRVWAVAFCEIKDGWHKEYCNNMDEFMQWLEKHIGDTLYFHNIKFDGDFIISYLLSHGWTFTEDKKKLKPKMFTALISDKGVFYSMELCFKTKKGYRYNTVKIFDSLKIIPFSIDGIAKTFGLPISKLKLDYHKYRGPKHKLTSDEIEYISNDVEIAARALKILFDQKLTKTTQGGNALNDFKKLIGKDKFNYWFPIPDYDADVRQSYKGGFTYLNPKYAGVDIEEGIVLDVNSLYPWVMHDCMLPYGEGKFFVGKYEEDEKYPLYVQMFRCKFELKENKIPTIQIKHNLAYVPNQYLESSTPVGGDEPEDIELCLTSVDLKLFFEQYNVWDIEWFSGWKFRGTDNLFREYIDKWVSIKIQADKEGNKGMRTLAKLMLNSLYGKLGLNPNTRRKYPYLDEEGVVRFNYGPRETRDPIYIPAATFITAWARDKTIRSAQTVYERFLYGDTDSLHLKGLEEPLGLEIDPYKLGAWKHESTFCRARFLRQKCYIEEEINTGFIWNGIYGGTKLKITCAGMTKSVYPHVTWENFKIGTEYPGKLRMKRVKGGIVLVNTTHKLKY